MGKGRDDLLVSEYSLFRSFDHCSTVSLLIYLFILSLPLSLFPSVCQVLFDVTFLVLDRDDETLDLAQVASISISLSAANEKARP
jgi:hypothetical protein